MNWRNSEKVSVLIAAHNAERTIGLAVKSSLIGLRSTDELLVFLDGCSDDTRGQLAKIKDSRLKVYESQANLGRVAARNALFEYSSGEIVCILDADDVSMPWRFALSRFLLRKYDVVFGSAILFGELPMGLFFITYPYRLSPRFSNILLTYKNPFVHSTVAMRRKCLTNTYLYNDVVAEEYDLWIRLAIEDNKIFRSALPFSGYRIHKSQISKNPDFYLAGEKCKVLQANRKKLIFKLQNEYLLDGDFLLRDLTKHHLGIRVEALISTWISKFRK